MADQPFLASNSFNGDGVTVVWEFSFEGLATDAPITAKPYIDSADVRAELITGEGEEQVTVQQAFLFETANSIRIEPAVPVGTVLRIYRVTENRFPLVNYQDLQSVGASDLDLANRQAVYIVQEARDAARGAGNISAEALAIAQGAAESAADAAAAAAVSAAAVADLPVDLADLTDPDLGAGLIGWYLDAVGATGITQAVKNAQRVSVASFGVTGVGDDTAGMIAAINWQISQRVTFNPTIGGVGGSAIVNGPVLTIPHNWTVSVQGDLPVWFALVSEGRSTIESLDNAKDIMKGDDSYMSYTADITFLHGKSQLVKQNANINAGMWLHERVWFEGANDYASQDLNTSGTYPVTSTQPIYNDCRWIRCKRGLKTQADHTFITGGWMQPGGDFFDADTAFIWTGGMLSLNQLMLIPGGTFPAKARWIDNHGAVRAFQTRFGGEGGGIPCIYHFAAPVRYLAGDAMSVECGISLIQSTLYGGGGARPDKGIVVIQGELPNVLRITDCTGPITAPYVLNDPAAGGIADITAYIAALKAAWSGDDMYGELGFHFRGNKSKFNTATVRWPAALDTFVYLDDGRLVKRASKTSTPGSQVIPSGVVTKLTLSTPVYDPYLLNVSDSVQIPPYARYCKFVGFVEVASHTATTNIYNARVFINGTSVADGFVNYIHDTTGIVRIQVSGQHPVTPGQLIDLRFFQASGTDKTVSFATLAVEFD